jgi:ferredoxin-type protein NapG
VATSSAINPSRRDFLRGRVAPRTPDTPRQGAGSPLPRVIAWLADPPEDAPAPPRNAAFPLLRPPGAVREETFVADCTRCARCIEACPHDAVRHAPARYRQAEGTPYIDPAKAPCRLCDDWPCIAACPEGVLSLQGAAAMGKARVQMHDCLNALGASCSVCAEQCPVPGAIELSGGRVTVREPLCTGCGVCHHVCPAPNNAVLILPARERPDRHDDKETGDGQGTQGSR